MSVLIVADRDDIHADCVASKASDVGHEVLRISPAHDFSKDFSLQSTDIISFTLGGKLAPLAAVTGVYCRVAAERLNECFAPRNSIERYSIEEESVAWLTALLLIPAQKWLNSPRSEIWADVKPHSLIQASQLGLMVPDFIITNSVSQALEFSKNRNTVIKPISDASLAFQSAEYLSVPDFGEFDTTGTRIFRLEEVDLDRLNGTPFLLQVHIERTYEYRATVVDSKVFVALAVLCKDRIDIKDSDPPKYNASRLPEQEESMLLKLTKLLGLRICTFDIVRSLQGDLYVIDINPQGNWLWLDKYFDGKISSKITESLT